MKNCTRSLMLQSTPHSQPGCPFGWSCVSEPNQGDTPPSESHLDGRYLQARRQGIYLAACIVDEVAALEVKSPQAVIDEIRRRICELVRYELSGSSAAGTERF